MDVRRRIGVPGAAALIGILLLLAGVSLTVIESQLRIDAATASVALTPRQLERLRETDIDDIGQDSYRNWLIIESMTSGGRVPALELTINDEDEGLSWSWGPAESSVARSWGGWQPKPLTGVTAAGLVLILGSLFLSASRWRRRYPPGRN